MPKNKSEDDLRPFVSVIDGKYVVVQPEDDDTVCFLKFRWWHYNDLLALARHYAYRYFRTTDKYWWRKLAPVNDEAWENGSDEELPGKSEANPRSD